MKRIALFVGLAAIAIGLAGCSYAATTSTTGSTSSNSSTSQPIATNAVAISNMAFSPASITVPVGTTVTWTNQDGVAHTVTGDGSNVPSGFGSGNLSNGQSYSFTFATAGTYTYHCSIHPQMTGTVVVQ